MKMKFTFALIATMALLVGCNEAPNVDPPTPPTPPIPPTPLTTPNPPAVDQIIEIGGLKWTTGNLVATNATNAKVGAPGDGGLYFQFGSLVGWSGGASGDGVGVGEPALAINAKPSAYTGSAEWTTGYYSEGESGGLPATDVAATGIGDPCRFYLGGEWRLPTTAEFASMCRGYGGPNLASANAAWTRFPSSGLNFNNNGTKLFIPASGFRHYSDGALYYIMALGYYWSESVNDAWSGYSLYFRHSGVYPQYNSSRRLGMPVRCVAGEVFIEPTKPNPPTADQIIEINGLKWTTGNLVATNATNATNAKVGAPDDGGLYFQFGSLVGWSGGATGDGVGTGSPALAVNVKPSAYTGFTDYATCGYYSADDLFPATDIAVTGIGDPCRFYLGGGWRLPTTAEFASMCNGYTGGVDLASANAVWVTSPVAGMNFNNSGTKLFIPASGRRNADGSMNNVGTHGYYWSESVYNADNGYNLYFNSGSVYPQNNNNRRLGMPVRCVQYPPQASASLKPRNLCATLGNDQVSYLFCVKM